MTETAWPREDWTEQWSGGTDWESTRIRMGERELSSLSEDELNAYRDMTKTARCEFWTSRSQANIQARMPRDAVPFWGRPTDKPIISMEINDIENIVDQGEDALIKADRGLYERGDAIVSIGTTKRVTAHENEVTVVRLYEQTEAVLYEHFSSAAHWQGWDGRKKAHVFKDPPKLVPKIYRERKGRRRLPPLAGVISAPTLRPNGSVLDQIGYDEQTALVLMPVDETFFPLLPPEPTKAHAEAAIAKLKFLVRTFPFASSVDQSICLSAFLTVAVRRSLRTAPMHCFSAPIAGSGKSMLVDICSILATGREAAVIAMGSTEEEFEKRLVAILKDGDQVLSIDNVEKPIAGDFICQIITQPTVKPRILGKSDAVELPTNTFVCSTGNNLVLLGDVTRRGLICTLDPKSESPEKRSFQNDPIADAKVDRGALVTACLTILRAYTLAGKPDRPKQLGSFGDWSDLIRGALLWLGEPDAIGNMEAAKERDPTTEKLRAVATQWAKSLDDRRVTVSEAIVVAIEKKANTNAFTRVTDGDGPAPRVLARPELRNALYAVAGEAGIIDAGRLGTWLGRFKNRVVSVVSEEGAPARKYQFARLPLVDGLTTWRLEEVGLDPLF